jgi:hypothetical protein
MAEKAGRVTRAGGNLSPPALDLLEDGPADLYVLELSSYQLETTDSLRLAAATVLNVTPDHLDRYVDLEAYAAAKARIFERAAVAVINLDDPVVATMAPAAMRRVTFSLRAGAGADFSLARQAGEDWLVCRGEFLLRVADMRIVGLHNAANALAALALGEAMGLERAAMLSALLEFPGLPHRSEWVADVAGVRYVNDSKGTNVGATLAAVAGSRPPFIPAATARTRILAIAQRRSARCGYIADRSRCRAHRRVPGGVCAMQHCASLKKPWSRRRTPRPAIPCCCHRRASLTCSVTTPIAARCSPTRYGGSRHERRGAVPVTQCDAQPRAAARSGADLHHAVDPVAGSGDGDVGVDFHRLA